MNFPIIIKCVSPDSFLGASVVVFDCNLVFRRNFSMQTEYPQMGRRVLRRHIWGYAVCICPTKRTPGFYCFVRPKSIRAVSYHNYTVLVQASKRQRLPSTRCTVLPLLFSDKWIQHSMEETVEIFSRPALSERRVLDVRINRIGHATGTQSPYYCYCCRLHFVCDA